MADVYFKIGYFDPRDNQWHEGQPPVVQQQPQSNQVIAGQSGQSTAYRQPQQVAVGANAPQYYYPQQQVPYTQVQQSTYYNPGGVPTQVALGVPSGPLVRYNYRPQQYNTGMNYGPWYGQQSYATRVPYAPNQPYYETVIGSDGRPRTIRMGEYEQMQPTHYETFYNSQGQLVQVPQYPAMNNSAVPVRRADQIIGGQNQPVASSTTSSAAATPRVRSMPEQVPNQQYIEERNTTSNQRLTNEELNALTGTTTETTYSDPTASATTATTATTAQDIFQGTDALGNPIPENPNTLGQRIMAFVTRPYETRQPWMTDEQWEENLAELERRRQ